MKQNVTASLIVIVHLLVLFIHGNAHLHLHIDTQRWQSAFIAIVIFVGPVLATALLWTRHHKAGAALMALTMAGAFAFGVINHFLIPGSDNALELHLGQSWKSLFAISAIGLGLIEAGGIVWGLLEFRNTKPIS
jgi:cytochrome bd-type quinol oxidase subunit 2